MSDTVAPLVTAKRKPWLLVLTHAQVSNPHAEEMGERNWLIFAFILILSCLSLTLPFMGRILSTSMVAGDPATYPGLSAVFPELKAAGRDFTITGGMLIPAEGTPPEETVAGWKIIWTGAGGKLPESLADVTMMPRTLGSQTDTDQPGILVFRKEGLNILHADGSAAMSGGVWVPLEGLRFQDLDMNEGNISAFLGSVAMSSVMDRMVSNLFMLSIQTILYVLVMGAFLSLSGIRIGMTGTVPTRRKKGFSRSVRSAAAVTLGPAFLVCMILLFFPSLLGFGFVAFSLLGGARVIWLYISRFPNKNKKT